MLWNADNHTRMTKGLLLELLEKVPDGAFINVLNPAGEFGANMDIWFENLTTRKFVTLSGTTPFWQLCTPHYTAQTEPVDIPRQQQDDQPADDSYAILAAVAIQALQDIVYQCGQASPDPAILGIITSANKAIAQLQQRVQDKASPVQEWLITVGNGYGSYRFTGTAAEAEKERGRKAQQEGTVATKRLAAPSDPMDSRRSNL